MCIRDRFTIVGVIAQYRTSSELQLLIYQYFIRTRRNVVYENIILSLSQGKGLNVCSFRGAQIGVY